MRLIDYYDAHGWATSTQSGLYPRQVVARELVLAAATGSPRTGLRVLDVGCGDGAFLADLARHLGSGVDYVGIDYSAHQLAQAAATYPDECFQFHECDLNEAIPLPDSSMDVIHGAEVVEHLYDPDRLVAECARVLRPGGRLVLTTPNPQAWYNRVLFLFGVQPLFAETSTRTTEVGAGALRRFKRDTRPVGHLRLFNRTALVDLVQLGGLRVTSVRGARYHDVPRAARWLDAAFCLRPSLASILCLTAEKPA